MSVWRAMKAIKEETQCCICWNTIRKESLGRRILAWYNPQTESWKCTGCFGESLRSEIGANHGGN